MLFSMYAMKPYWFNHKISSMINATVMIDLIHPFKNLKTRTTNTAHIRIAPMLLVMNDSVIVIPSLYFKY